MLDDMAVFRLWIVTTYTQKVIDFEPTAHPAERPVLADSVEKVGHPKVPDH
ncbi:hypothetical protein M1M11_25365 [Pseudomonas azerbaijanoccidens]|uniref:hypothetical protein n=1 Tax=Pseudomonas azerbaijanoccidentalis TaxID=2842347 RepID=UPI002009EE61|nr:hypothetical protein [Pseudomonas azerbaijanoccidentalis]MCK8668215.1 hypothetical protein [Pseudomonas azerbaijanoccidentalis]